MYNKVFYILIPLIPLFMIKKVTKVAGYTHTNGQGMSKTSVLGMAMGHEIHNNVISDIMPL